MKTEKKTKQALREAKRRNKADARDMGKFEMRPRNPYEILRIKKPVDDRLSIEDRIHLEVTGHLPEDF